LANASLLSDDSLCDLVHLGWVWRCASRLLGEIGVKIHVICEKFFLPCHVPLQQKNVAFF
jgi:hypothetical protein